MVQIEGFQVAEQLYASDNSNVYRAKRNQDKLPCIIKVLNKAYPSPEEVNEFTKEFQVAQALSNLPGINQSLDILPYQNTYLIVMEDIGGESLDKLIKSLPLSLDMFFSMAIQLVEILEKVHDANYIHKDINPSNLILNLENNSFKLIDFGLSASCSKESVSAVHPNRLEGTLQYISPEQTGRMNRTVDYRTDYYSLGVTFYELLTGRLPFRKKDMLGLIHSHIAESPQTPHELNSNIPMLLSAIIMRLMSKNAEDRYQSAKGLLHDLRFCFENLDKPERFTEFILGEKDLSQSLLIPEKLYGRDEELSSLMQAFDMASAGKSETFFISGLPGIGKTVLINELHKPVTSKNAFFLSGKFDQLQRTTPYSAIIQAIDELVVHVLSLDEESVRFWKEKVLGALKENGAVLSNVINRLEHLIGPQAAVESVPPLEAQNRFNAVFKSFIRLFATHKHPLVLFIDDLQWADLASLNIIKELISDEALNYFLFLGAYRSNEVDKHHAFIQMCNDLNDKGISYRDIRLGSLQKEHLSNLLGDTFHMQPSDTTELANLVIAKTNGNPFFSKEFVINLHANELLFYDSRWKWHIDKIEQSDITENVVDMMVEKISSYPDSCRSLIEIAACIGVNFPMNWLSVLTAKGDQELLAELSPAINAGSLIRGTENIWFAHDKVQEAAYTLITQEQKAKNHYRLGKFFSSQNMEEEHSEHVFLVVSQLNKAIPLLSHDEKADLIKRNTLAGTIAKDSTAYGAASSYFKIASELLPADSWRVAYDESLAIYKKWGETEFSAGNFERAAELFEVVKEKAQNFLEKIDIYSMEIDYLCGIGKLKEALEVVYETLEHVEVEIPKNIDGQTIEAAYAEIDELLGGKVIEDIRSLNVLRDPVKKAALNILNKSIAPAYLTDPTVLTFIILKMVSYSLKYGNTEHSCMGYAIYPVLLYTMKNDPNSAFEFGSMAMHLVEQFDSKMMKGRVIYTFGAVSCHFKRQMRESFDYLLRGGELCYEVGDLQFYGYAISLFSYMSMLSGTPLPKLKVNVFEKHMEALKQVHLDQVVNQIFVWHQVLENLQGKNDLGIEINGEYSKIERVVEDLIANSDYNSMCHYAVSKSYLCYFLEEYEKGYEIANKYKIYTPGLVAQYAPEAFQFYYAMLMLAVLDKVNDDKKKDLIQEVQGICEHFKDLAQYSPNNYLHKHQLILAELKARGSTPFVEVIDLYDKAILGAKSNDFLQEQALANECVVSYLLKKGLTKFIKPYLTEAVYAYQKWGCAPKVSMLKARYADFLEETQNRADDLLRVPNLQSTVQSTSKSKQDYFDIATVIKASQSISGETNLQALSEKIVDIAIENAGAEKGIMILNRDDGYYIEAIADINAKEPVRFTSILVDDFDSIPKSIVHYVANTKEILVLDQANENPSFALDGYVSSRQLKSVICMPILHRSMLSGIFYLENNQASNTFKANSVEVLKILAAQAAISIENARLVDQLQMQNEEIRAQNIEYEKLNQELTRANKELILAKEKAEESDTLKTEFFQNMSHEIRTPLNGILGFSNLLKDPSLTAENQNMYTDIIVKSGNQLLRIIDDILEVSQLSVGQVEVDAEEVCISELLMDAYEEFKHQAINNKTPIQVAIDLEDRECKLFTDRVKVTKMLVVLLDNALKFTEKGFVEMGCRFKGANAEKTLELYVKDTGVGIYPQNIDRIFERFWQEEKELSYQAEGLGLGLSIVKAYSDLLGGQITVNSIKEKGTEIILAFPVELPNFAELDKVESAKVNKAKDILIVEDEEANYIYLRELLKYELDHEGQILHATNGAIAVDMVDSNSNIGLVFMDLRMPVMNGIEASKIIMKSYPSMPIIVQTAFTTAKDREEAFSAGCRDFVSKPIKLYDIQKIVEKYIS